MDGVYLRDGFGPPPIRRGWRAKNKENMPM
jgi:hypothetical protein